MKRFVLLVVSFLMATMLFADPFGLKMGMTLEEIKAKCGGKEPEYECHGIMYKIEPIKKDGTFIKYSAFVNENLGLFGVTAGTELVSTERRKKSFNAVLSKLKDYYGEPSEVDELTCRWYADKCEKLKKEKLNGIFLRIFEVTELGGEIIFLDYFFENSEKAMESRDSPF